MKWVLYLLPTDSFKNKCWVLKCNWSTTAETKGSCIKHENCLDVLTLAGQQWFIPAENLSLHVYIYFLCFPSPPHCSYTLLLSSLPASSAHRQIYTSRPGSHSLSFLNFAVKFKADFWTEPEALQFLSSRNFFSLHANQIHQFVWDKVRLWLARLKDYFLTTY